MNTIIEPKRHIANLWSKPRIGKEECVRLSRYVMKVECGGKILLHNVVTGQLAVLDQEEAAYLNNLPGKNSSVINDLIDGHYIVPIEYDEHQQVIKMRYILRRLNESNTKYITQFRIFPTTACNARCYYCFEQGMRVVTMTEKTADDVVEFIRKNCGPEKKVKIMWFGGEPMVASQRIDQICLGLKENRISFRSQMTSNGYLFDEEMVDRAKNLWHLQSVQITVDGTEDNYNKIKAYVNVSGSPYQKVLNNIGLLLEQEIRVGMRMNFDIESYHDFYSLVDEALMQFGRNPYLHISAFPIVGEYDRVGKKTLHGSDEWFAEKIVELNEYARKSGISQVKGALPVLRYVGCEADYDSAIGITPDGNLIRCGEQYGIEESIGTIWDGIIDPERASSWKRIADIPNCAACTFFPACIRLCKCSAGDRCNFQDRNRQYVYCAQQQYKKWLSEDSLREDKKNHDVKRTGN